MPSLFDGTYEHEDPEAIFNQMESNYPGFSLSVSAELWKLQRECFISDHNPRRETMLEKAVVQLAESGHMPKWFNQCPVASGIVDSRIDGGRRVDLVHWSETSGQARLVELKWRSSDPTSTLQQVLRYGMAYLFCRVHIDELPLQGRSLMNACHIELEVAAPFQFYARNDDRNRFASVNESLGEFARSITGGALAMSLRALAFPKEFDEVPFADGQDVKEKCSTEYLTDEGRMVRDAFEGLTPVWSDLQT